MVIFFAGLPGVGKSSLARAISQKLAISHFDIDEVKKEMYPKLDSDYQYKLDNNIPFSDEANRGVFVEAVKKLNALAATTPTVIVDEMLHEKSLRKILFDAAEKYFGGHILVWVVTDEELTKQRLLQGRSEHLLKDPVGTYLVFKERFEPFQNADIIFHNDAPLEESVEKLTYLLQDKLS